LNELKINIKSKKNTNKKYIKLEIKFFKN
jgi:hypothetical protein